MFSVEFKKYLKHFRVLFIILALVAVGYFAVYTYSSNKEPVQHNPSGNTERVYGDQRVFDYADQLTDSEEAELEAYIHEVELQIESDIVIVTLNEPLEFYELEYRSKYDIYVDPSKWVMVYADKFWEDNKFGYDQPQILDGTPYSGDGVILVDNMYREGPENKIYTWMGTTGKCERAYSSAMIDNALDRFYDEVEYDYYNACVKFVKQVGSDMGGDMYKSPISADSKLPIVVAVIVTFIYCLCNWHSKAAQVTVDDKTYLIDKRAHFDVNEDTFIRKTVSKTSISSSSSGSGGGGHHTSGGGGSHGGGGHSR